MWEAIVEYLICEQPEEEVTAMDVIDVLAEEELEENAA